jgi:N-carbamoylputrescine amidase
MRCKGDREANLKNAAAMVRRAAQGGAEIISLPELFLGPYFCAEEAGEHFERAEPIPGPTTDTLSRLARELQITLIGGSIFEREGVKDYYNTSVVFGPDGTLLGVYRKCHIPDDHLFYEAQYFHPGDRGFRVFTVKDLRFGVLICYDQWFPEAARALALRGASVIFYPTAIGHIRGEPQWEGKWEEAWEIVQRGHAIANGVYIAAVNRVGREGKLQFWGRSFLCDPFGRVLKRAGRHEEEVILARIDPERGVRIQKGWGFLKKRRPEIYGDLLHSVR